jgi:predicted membrane channel-forming protein YqfA (hemolysin III family)
MIDLKKLFDAGYLFDWLPPRESEIIFAFAVIFGLAIILSGLVWVYFIRKERFEPILQAVRSRIVFWLFVSGLVGLLLVFFRWQGIPYFAGRIWLLAWLILSLLWAVALLGYLLKKFPKERSLYQERLLRERYLPKPKKESR